MLSGRCETHLGVFFQALWNSGLFRELLHRMKALHQLLPASWLLVCGLQSYRLVKSLGTRVASEGVSSKAALTCMGVGAGHSNDFLNLYCAP